ncbi:MAG: hypothetical protein R6V40_01865 [Candidatus Moraniibacteriota bacterium]
MEKIEKKAEKDKPDLLRYLLANNYLSRKILRQAVAENYEIPCRKNKNYIFINAENKKRCC